MTARSQAVRTVRLGRRRWTVRGQSDIHVRAGLDVSRAPSSCAKAASTFITDDSDAEIPVRRSPENAREARWASDDRLFVTAGLRVEDIRRDTLARFADPHPRPAFGENRVVSTNPRVAVAWFARRRRVVHETTRRRRHRHPSAGCV